MKIRSIEIKNVKGISQRLFELTLIPNKPNLLVAPNGFGKSSFATAFNSLNSKRLDIDEKDFYKGDKNNEPELTISVEDESNNIVNLEANRNSNLINDQFDVFVINSQLIAKARKRKIGSNTIAQSSMEVLPVVLIGSIPTKANFEYNKKQIKQKFGSNGKILPDISSVLCSSSLLDKIINNFELLNKFNGENITNAIEKFIENVKKERGTTKDVKELILSSNYFNDLRGIQYINDLYQIINSVNIKGLNDETDRFLASIQLIIIYKANPSKFKNACKYELYKAEKKEYEELFKSFNSSWIDIKIREERGKLIIEFPKAYQISNGQRDILSFIALLQKAKIKLKKQKCILVIDEVFDYLDDANLISVQYYITQMIEQFKLEQRQLFPLIMTHLNPSYFNHFCFNKHKIRVHYLDTKNSLPNQNLMNLIKKREDSTIKTEVDEYYFHYHPSSTNIRDQFRALGLKETWGESQNFHQFIQGEIDKYLNNQGDFDPFSICLGTRNKIEELLYKQILDSSQKDEFIMKHGTTKKLDYVEEDLGIDVPEIYYLLGIIYNDGLHWHEHRDNISPIAIKLENLTIRKMINEIFNSNNT